MKVRLFYTVIILLWTTSVQAQYRNSFAKSGLGVGALLGFGNENKSLPNTFGYGLKADYQLNFSSWFSLRFEGAYMQNKDGYTERTYSNSNEKDQNFNKPSAFYVDVAPLVYGRYEKFNFFIGCNLGGAQTWNKRSSYYWKNNAQGDLEKSFVEHGTTSQLAFGINPVLGFSIPMYKKGRQKNEIEIAFSMNRWLNTLKKAGPYGRPFDYRFYHIQLTYRFLKP